LRQLRNEFGQFLVEALRKNLPLGASNGFPCNNLLLSQFTEQKNDPASAVLPKRQNYLEAFQPEASLQQFGLFRI